MRLFGRKPAEDDIEDELPARRLEPPTVRPEPPTVRDPGMPSQQVYWRDTEHEYRRSLPRLLRRRTRRGATPEA
jgi:hypothetical protein